MRTRSAVAITVAALTAAVAVPALALAPGGSGIQDVFVRDLDATTTTFVSRAPGASGGPWRLPLRPGPDLR